MAEHIPVVGMCNLVGDDFTLNDVIVYRLSDFLKTHKNLVSPHRHSFFQVLFFTNGKGKHTIDFESYKVCPGQIYFMAPGQVHAWDFDSSIEGYLVNFTETFFSSVFINPNYVADFPFFSGVPGDYVLKVPVKIREEILAIFRLLEAECHHSREYKYDYIRCKLMEIFVLISRNLVNDKVGRLNRNNYLILRNFQKLIELHYTSKKLPREYAELLFITPNHLNALCKSSLGKSSGEFIRNRILLESKRLLVNSDLSVTQIANHLNFDDNSYFVKFFKKYVGVIPDDFRKTKLAIK
jgi:AraC-like DNA-binding protein